jgi:trehalose 6-phosphate phosphatase
LVRFLAEHLDPTEALDIDLYGRYGAEHRGRDGVIHDVTVSEELRAHLLEIATEAAQEVPGVLVEDKGASLSLHWRTHPEAEAGILELALRHAARGNIEAREGKMIVEFLGRGASTKGVVVASLCTGPITTCCFLGDDLGDLEAFDALDDFEARGGVAIRIGVGSSDMPAALRARSDLLLNNPSEAVAFLTSVADRLS